MSRTNFFSWSLVDQPLIWGGTACLGFYTLIDQDLFSNDLMKRYFASHPVEYVTAALFFVGLAAIFFKAINLIIQFSSLKRPVLSAVPKGKQSLKEIGSLLDSLEQLSSPLRNSYYVRRLRKALGFVHRKGTAESLDEQIRYLAEEDIARMYSSYSLVRIIIWAIPILGFLGTVIGITLAIAKLSPESLENSLPEVTSGLGVAFDTTALALTLSIVLMFSKFFVERLETKLLFQVDAKVASLLVGRFQPSGMSSDPHVALIQRMAKTIIRSTESLIIRQTEIWRETIDEANERFSQLTFNSGKQLETVLTQALEISLRHHAESLVAAEESMAEKNYRRWDQVHHSLTASAGTMVKQQTQLASLGETLRQVVEATGQVANLEAELNKNLTTLAGARHFEETVMSLSAAIQLLSARLGQDSTQHNRVDLTNSLPSNAA